MLMSAYFRRRSLCWITFLLFGSLITFLCIVQSLRIPEQPSDYQRFINTNVRRHVNSENRVLVANQLAPSVLLSSDSESLADGTITNRVSFKPYYSSSSLISIVALRSKKGGYWYISNEDKSLIIIVWIITFAPYLHSLFLIILFPVRLTVDYKSIL